MNWYPAYSYNHITAIWAIDQGSPICEQNTNTWTHEHDCSTWIVLLEMLIEVEYALVTSLIGLLLWVQSLQQPVLLSCFQKGHLIKTEIWMLTQCTFKNSISFLGKGCSTIIIIIIIIVGKICKSVRPHLNH